MLQINKLSPARVIIFILVLIILFYYYYTKSLKGIDGKGVKIIKLVLKIIVVFGLVNTYLTTIDIDLKILLLCLLIIILIIGNLNPALKKCPNISSQYKVTLYIKIIIVVFVAAYLIRMFDKTGLLTFLYSSKSIAESDNDNVISELVKYKKDDYCPNMNNYPNKFDKNEQSVWSALSSEQKNNCIARKSGAYERKDISQDIYA
jgi:hypothetical protein